MPTAIGKNLRSSGLVVRNDEALLSDEADDDADDDVTIEDLRIQEGLDDEDDETYPEVESANPQPHVSSRTPRARDSAPSQSHGSESTFSAVVHNVLDNRPVSEHIRGPIHAVGQAPMTVVLPATPAGSGSASASTASPTLQPFTATSPNVGDSPVQSRCNKRTSTEAFPDAAQEQTARVLHRALKKDAANALRMRYKHYRSDQTLYRVMRLTGHLLQVQFATQNPFPFPEEREDSIQMEFSNALKSWELSPELYTLTDDDFKLLQTEETNVHSRVVKIVNTGIADAYGLIKAPRSQPEIEQNKAEIKKLLAKSVFHFEKPGMGIGRFQHPFIWAVISEAFFSSPNALGCLFQAHFKLFSHELIALVLTCIRHGLQKWETGRKLPRRFSGNHYAVFDQYLAALEQFDDSLMQWSWRTYQGEQFKIALIQAGCIEQGDHVESVIDLAKDDELERELERIKMKLGDVAVASRPFDFSGEIEIEEPTSSNSGSNSNIPGDDDDDDADDVNTDSGRPSRVQASSSQCHPPQSTLESSHTPVHGPAPAHEHIGSD